MKVLFVCKQNSCRSQMAEGFLKHFVAQGVVPGYIETASCGLAGSKVNENAVKVMSEIGLDISAHASKPLSSMGAPGDWDSVVSLCGCGASLPEDWVPEKLTRFADWQLDDPPALDPGDLSVYRRVRDEIKERVLGLARSLCAKTNVLFCCKKNSCRSQMAEGFLRFFIERGVVPAGFSTASCGLEGSQMNPNAVTVMQEIGIDISAQTSKPLASMGSPADWSVVISLCGCGASLPADWAQDKLMRFEDWQLDDPPACDPGDLSVYRRVRDEIRERVLTLTRSIMRAPSVLFCCKANSCRSQMAEGFLRHFIAKGVIASGFSPASCGLAGSEVNPNMVKVMAEVGIDVTNQTSKPLSSMGAPADWECVISLCGCGASLPEEWAPEKLKRFEDWQLDDPPKLDPGDLSVYRRVRDEIRERILALGSSYSPAPSVLFCCKANSCRSQMAEGFLRFFIEKGTVPRGFSVGSCGLKDSKVNPNAMQVMGEIGINISGQSSKPLASMGSPADWGAVISLCGCGASLPEDWAPATLKRFEDWQHDDPPALDTGDLSVYRRVRDEIRLNVMKLAASIQTPPLTQGSGKSVLFCCKANSCRSQMAEGFMKHFIAMNAVAPGFTTKSCGLRDTQVNPNAIKVMAEVGIDISGHTSDALASMGAPADWDQVISLCGCGTSLPEDWAPEKLKRFEDWHLDDPPALDTGDLSVYRRVRDQIRVRVLGLAVRLAFEGGKANAEVVLEDGSANQNVGCALLCAA